MTCYDCILDILDTHHKYKTQPGLFDPEIRDNWAQIYYLDNSSIVCRLKNPFQQNVLQTWRDEIMNNIKWDNPTHESGVTLNKKVKWFSQCDCSYQYTPIKPLKPTKYLSIIDTIEYFMLKALKIAYPGMFDWIKDNCTDCCHVAYYDHDENNCLKHSDDECIFDSTRNESCIFSFSLGENGMFDLYEKCTNHGKYTKELESVYDAVLHSGDILVMIGLCQRNYVHEAINRKKGRLNLTYRHNRLHQNACPYSNSARSISKYLLSQLQIDSKFESKYP